MKSPIKYASLVILTLLLSGCYIETKSSDCGLHDFDCDNLATMADTKIVSVKPASAISPNFEQRIKKLEQRIQQLENRAGYSSQGK